MDIELTDISEVLFRQIHPSSIHDGEPSSDRFRPSQRDSNRLSVDRSSLTSAEDAHRLYTSSGRKSAAVYGLTVGEFKAETIPCKEAPILNHARLPDNSAHSLADYSAHEKRGQKILALRLKQLAIARGCLFEGGNDLPIR